LGKDSCDSVFGQIGPGNSLPIPSAIPDAAQFALVVGLAFIAGPFGGLGIGGQSLDHLLVGLPCATEFGAFAEGYGAAGIVGAAGLLRLDSGECGAGFLDQPAEIIE